jgi:hypothetical protein
MRAGALVARVNLVRDNDEHEDALASLVERRIWYLRQLYAVLLLVYTGRSNFSKDVRMEDGRADLELLVPSEYRLQLIGAGKGSFWADVVVDLAKKGFEKVRKVPDVVMNGLSLLCGEGWYDLMQRVKAGTNVNQAEARIKLAKAKERGSVSINDAQLCCAAEII